MQINMYNMDFDGHLLHQAINVEETPATYRVKDRAATLSYRLVLNKKQEGEILDNYRYSLFLVDRDDEKAKTIISDFIQDIIRIKQEEISKLENKQNKMMQSSIEEIKGN